MALDHGYKPADGPSRGWGPPGERVILWSGSSSRWASRGWGSPGNGILLDEEPSWVLLGIGSSGTVLVLGPWSHPYLSPLPVLPEFFSFSLLLFNLEFVAKYFNFILTKPHSPVVPPMVSLRIPTDSSCSKQEKIKYLTASSALLFFSQFPEFDMKGVTGISAQSFSI